MIGLLGMLLLVALRSSCYGGTRCYGLLRGTYDAVQQAAELMHPRHH